MADPSEAAPFWRDALDAPNREDVLFVESGALELFFHLADQPNAQGGLSSTGRRAR